jgi:hypothetical protein
VAVVRFRHRFLEDQLDDGFQLCTALNLENIRAIISIMVH